LKKSPTGPAFTKDPPRNKSGITSNNNGFAFIFDNSMNRLVCLRWLSKSQRKGNFPRNAHLASTGIEILTSDFRRPASDLRLPVSDFPTAELFKTHSLPDSSLITRHLSLVTPSDVRLPTSTKSQATRLRDASAWQARLPLHQSPTVTRLPRRSLGEGWSLPVGYLLRPLRNPRCGCHRIVTWKLRRLLYSFCFCDRNHL
jgi:hypothetical protein